MADSSAIKALFNEIQGDLLLLPYIQQLLKYEPIAMFNFDGNLTNVGSDGKDATGNETYVPGLIPSNNAQAIELTGTEFTTRDGIGNYGFADTTIVWTHQLLSTSGTAEIFDTNSVNYSDGTVRDKGLRISQVDTNLLIRIGGDTFNSSNVTTDLAYNNILPSGTDVAHCVLVLNERLGEAPSLAQIDSAINFYVNGEIVPVTTYTQSAQWDEPRGSFVLENNFLEFGFFDGSGVATANTVLDTWAFINQALTPAQVAQLVEAHNDISSVTPKGQVVIDNIATTATSANITFSFDGIAETATGFEYSLDSGPYISVESPLELTGLTEGQTYNVDFRAVNANGAGSQVTSDSFVAEDSSPFTPASINTFAWYDADDSATLTTSGSSVTQWDDKSGNGYNLTQTTSSDQPTVSTNGSLPSVLFDGTADNLRHDVSGTLGFPTATFIVCGDVTTNGYALSINDSLSDDVFYGLTQRDPGNKRFTYIRQNAGAASFMTESIPDLSRAILSSVSRTSSDHEMLRNGSSIGTDTGAWPSVSYNNIALGQLRYQSSSLSFGGHIQEVVVVDESLSEVNRQKIEGYLAHKWNLTAELPSGHPYKNDPPLES